MALQLKPINQVSVETKDKGYAIRNGRLYLCALSTHRYPDTQDTPGEGSDEKVISNWDVLYEQAECKLSLHLFNQTQPADWIASSDKIKHQAENGPVESRNQWWDHLPAPPDAAPGYWAKIARDCLWDCSRRLVANPKQLLFFLSSQDQQREPVLIGERTGGRRNIYQSGTMFAISVGKRKANVEALFGHSVGDHAEVPCVHCSQGWGRFQGCILIKTPKDEVIACSNCHWNNQSHRCSLSTTHPTQNKPPKDGKGGQGDGSGAEPDQEMLDFVKGWLPRLERELAKARRGSVKKRMKVPRLEKEIRVLRHMMGLKAEGEILQDSKVKSEKAGDVPTK